jgi:Chaperone of endosialidase
MGFFDIFSTDDQQKAAQDQIAGLNKGYSQLSDLFGQGRSALTSNYTAGLQPFLQNLGTAQGGTNQLASLLGFGPNGSAGIADTLKNLPGYQFALDQGDQNILRNQAATGQLNSGGTNLDLQKFGQGLASQNYFNYANQLQPFLGAAGNAASGIGTLNAGLGNQLNANLMTQGNAAYGTQAGIGNANAQADLAGLTQSGNIWGAALGILSDARAKDDIEPVGELFDGQPVFRYRYKGDPRHQIGLIAQEVEERAPSAVVHDFAGTRFKGVDYRRATDMAAELGKFLRAA